MKYEYRYFKNGVDNGKPDIIVILSRPDQSKFVNWTDQQFADMKKHIEKELNPVIDRFIKELT